MKVHELIEILKKCDPDAYVVIPGDEETYNFEGFIGVHAEYVEPNYPTSTLYVEDWQFTHSPKPTEQQVIFIG